MIRVLAIIISFLSFFSARSQAPTFKWAKGFGGTAGDGGYTTVTDAIRNIYVMGNFWSTVDMDPGPGIFNLTSAGQGDIFISKFDSSGNFIWAKQIGNSFDDEARNMFIDNNNNLFLTGQFNGTVDFDPGPGVFNLSCNTTSFESFLLKLDSAGNFKWACKLTDTDYGSSGWEVTVGPSGNVYAVGLFKGTGDFDPGPGVFNMSSTPNADDIFISKFDNNGNFIWARQFTGTNGKVCYSIVLDPLENVYTTGTFYGTCDFDPGPATYNLTANSTAGPGWSDVYITKLNINGNFVFAKQVSGEFNDIGWGMTVDPTGAIFVTGEFSGIADFDPGPGTYFLNAGIYSDGYVLKLDNTGNFAWAVQFDSAGAPNSTSRGFSVTLDNQGNVYSIGDFTGGVDFDPGPSNYILSSTAIEDSYISKLSPSGNFIFALHLASTNFVQSHSLMVDAQKNIFSTGWFGGTTDFDPGPAVFNLTSNGSTDVYLLKLSQTCTQSSSSTINDTACNSYTLNGQTYTTSGIYTQILVNSAGCDSILTLNLTIYGSTTTTAVSACNIYIWQGQTYTTSGSYNRTFTDIHGCDSVLILVLIINHGTTTNINATICEGQSYAGHSASGTYADTLLAANGCDSIRILFLLVNPRKFTTVTATICQGQVYPVGIHRYTITGVYTDSLLTYLGCDSIISTHLLVNPSPKPDLGPDRGICAGITITLNPGSFSSYLWQDGTILPGITTNTTGLYWVMVKNSFNCSARDSLLITTIYPVPANFLKAKDSICMNKDLVLQSQKSYSSYIWSTGATQDHITIQSPGRYWLSVNDGNGCRGEETIQVISRNCFTAVFLPNAFTPNGDGYNDLFRASVLGNLVSFRLEVYDRSGQLIFTTNNSQLGWDGTFKGKPFSTASFVWQCFYQLEGRLPEFQTGSVVLVR